ncbi:MAG: hypothetical protein ABSE59_10955 [Opitutaceae bacterium]
MNLPHALGFFVLGLAMAVLPELAPVSASPNFGLGDVTSLWLEFMGGVMLLIGSGGTAKCLAAAWPKTIPGPRTRAKALSAAQAESQSALASTANRAAI